MVSLEDWRLLRVFGSPLWRLKNKYIAIFDQKGIIFIFYCNRFFYIRNLGLDPDKVIIDPKD
jgi:hypothetical protein